MHFRGDATLSYVFCSFRKWVYSIRKEFAPRGRKFFFHRVGLFQKGIGEQESKQEVTKFPL